MSKRGKAQHPRRGGRAFRPGVTRSGRTVCFDEIVMKTHSSLDIETLPYWIDSASFPTFAKIDRDVDVDVGVVGGGLTGLTTAYMLTSAGKSVALIERGRCAEIDTAHATAHLTMVTDTRLNELVGRFGRSHAQAVWDAGRAAIDQIERI